MTRPKREAEVVRGFSPSVRPVEGARVTNTNTSQTAPSSSMRVLELRGLGLHEIDDTTVDVAPLGGKQTLPQHNDA